jgi:chitin disaccharide deacetylase
MFFKNIFFPSIAEQLGYTRKDIIVIVNIDDVGMHRDEVKASFEVLNFGMVKSGSVMVPCPGFNDVVNQWKKSPDLDLGIHLTLTCEWGQKYPWPPVLSSEKVPSLYNPQGIMWSNVKELLLQAKRNEILMELEAQINKVLEMGLKPTHLDHHMDFYYYDPGLFVEIMGLSNKYNLPMRVWRRRKYRLPFVINNLMTLRRKGFIFADTQMGLYTLSGSNQTLDFRKNKYFKHLCSLKPGVHNIKVHIAPASKEIESLMGLHDSSIRQIDYEVWTSEETKRIAQELGIVFIGYRPLQLLQYELMRT